MSNVGEEARVGATGNGTDASRSASSTASVRNKSIPRNAPGQRQDVGWLHGVSVEGNKRKIKCKYCEKVFNRGVYRFKHHLAGTKKDVEECRVVPDDVRSQMWDIVGLQEKLIRKTSSRETDYEESIVDSSGKRKLINESVSTIFKKRGVSSQTTLNTIFKKSLKEDVDLRVATFFYNNVIPFNVAKDDAFHHICEGIASFGAGYKPPSYYDIRVKLLKKKVEITDKISEEHQVVWKRTGCTIMTDGWTDKRRTILNFLVNSPKGTFFLKSIDASDICKTADKIFKMMDEVVEEVGEKNVVQIVTDNAANYKAAGELLMEKRKKLYWTPCAAHYIDLMLEDFENIPLHQETIANGKKITTYIYSRTSLISLLHHFTNGGDLIRPALTRFATSYVFGMLACK